MTGLRDRRVWLALTLALGGWMRARADGPPPAVFPAESKADRRTHRRNPHASGRQEVVAGHRGDSVRSYRVGRRPSRRRAGTVRGLSATVPRTAGLTAAGRPALLSRGDRPAGAEATQPGHCGARRAAAAQGGGRGVLQPAGGKGSRPARRPGVRARRLRGGRTVVAPAAAAPDRQGRFASCLSPLLPRPTSRPGPDASQGAVGPTVRRRLRLGRRPGGLSQGPRRGCRRAGRKDGPLRRHPPGGGCRA